VLDAKGIGDTDLLVHANGLVLQGEKSLDLDLDYEFTINSTESTIDGTLESHISSQDEMIDLGNLFTAIWSNASDYTRILLDISQVPSDTELSIYLNDSTKLDYTGSRGLDHVLLDMRVGDIDQLMDEPYWAHGVVIRNGTDENDDQIMQRAELGVEQDGDDTGVDLEINDWRPDTGWVTVDIMGLNDRDILLYQNLNGISSLDMDLNLDITAPEGGETVLAYISYEASRDLGGVYLKFRSPEIINPIILQLYLHDVPRSVEADVAINNGISASYQASKPVDHMFARLHRFVDGEWYYLTLMLHDIPDHFEASLSQNRDFDPERSPILQGNPNIRFSCSQDGMDVHLDMDGMVNFAAGHTTLQVGDLTNDTSLTLKEPDVYSIRSSRGIGFVYLVLSDLPVLKSFTIKELYIYAEDVKSVDINVRQLFGLYPIFKLSNADGGRIHVKLEQRVNLGDSEIPLEAGVLDVRYKSYPLLIPLFINHISAKLSTNHLIIPEPVTTVVATFLALVSRFFGGLL